MASLEKAPVADLLTKARAGDPQALENLFSCCRNYMSILARTKVESWLRAKVDSSDLVQQTLLEAYRDFARFKGETEAEWLGWLRQILANNTADFVRQFHGTGKRKVGREVALAGNSDAPSCLADSVETASQQLLRKERELQVADAVAQLSADHQEVILLRNLERLSFEEVARRMGRSRPAVQMLWMRAVGKLQESLAEML